MSMRHWLVAGLVVAGLSTEAQAKQAVPCKPAKTVAVKARGVRGVAWTPDGRSFVTGNVDGTLRIYNAKNGKAGNTLKGHSMEVYSVAVSPDGKWAASGGEDKKVILWDLRRGKQKAVLTGHQHTVRSVAFTADGKTLLSASLDRQLGTWDVATGKLKEMLGGQACILMAVASSGGKLKGDAPLAGTACNDGLVRVWNLETGKPQFALEGHEAEVHAITFAQGKDNPPMATGDNESRVIIWDVRGKTALHTFEDVGWTDAVAFSPDATILVAAGNDMAQKGLFKLFDVKDGKLINEQFPHDGNIPSVAFSPDGKTLLTASMDETVKVWDVGKLKKGCE